MAAALYTQISVAATAAIKPAVDVRHPKNSRAGCLRRNCRPHTAYPAPVDRGALLLLLPA